MPCFAVGLTADEKRTEIEINRIATLSEVRD